MNNFFHPASFSRGNVDCTEWVVKKNRGRTTPQFLKILDSRRMLCQLRDMDADERDIYLFLKSWGSEFIAAREICRRAGGKKRFHENPEWAKPILSRMEERGILESNATAHYRIKPLAKRKHGKRWVSPDIAKILKESGVEVESAGEETGLASDEYYEQL